jgi:hypothetical protein
MASTKMKTHITLGILMICCLLFLYPQACLGLIGFTGGGDEPVADGGWPLGSVAMANLPTRVVWWQGSLRAGGEWHFLYRCQSTQEFNQALRAFASIRAPKREVVLHDGPRYGLLYEKWEPDPEGSQPGANDRFDWTFTIWNPERWYRLSNSVYRRELGAGRPVPAPRLDVYIGGGAIAWDQVELPEGLLVTDERAESAPVKPVGGGLIEGDVFDICTGKPVAGAEITVTDIAEEEGAAPARGRTDELGSFRIQRIPRGWYRIAIRADGYASRQLKDLYPNRGDRYHRVTTTLAPAAAIEGVVTDMAGKPITGAEVHATHILGIDGQGYEVPDVAPALTDAQGRFEIGSLPRGFVQLRCRVPSMHLAKSTCDICQVPGKPVELTMEGTGTVRGRVVDSKGNVPAGEIYVEVRPVGDPIGKWGGSMRCEPDGSFEFDEVPPGEYLVSSNPALLIEGRDPDAVRISVKVGETIELEIVDTTP